jgi:hypothetical protein
MKCALCLGSVVPIGGRLANCGIERRTRTLCSGEVRFWPDGPPPGLNFSKRKAAAQMAAASFVFAEPRPREALKKIADRSLTLAVLKERVKRDREGTATAMEPRP